MLLLLLGSLQLLPPAIKLFCLTNQIFTPHVIRGYNTAVFISAPISSPSVNIWPRRSRGWCRPRAW